MKQNMSRLFVFALTLSLIISFQPAQAQPVYAISPDIVISQVYGGGGNTGAQYQNDFVELYNRGTIAIDVTGWSIQYASAAGSSWQRTILSGVIGTGKYYLIQEAVGTSCGGSPCGIVLPPSNATGTIPMSLSAGKVALVNNSTTLTGTCPTGTVDFVGFGTTANCYEGAPMANLSNTTAALRNSNGATDTDNNKNDCNYSAR
ncbi:MAG: lamin tail domain-containing protein [Chloroflexi bacterium]|nr:lamin tail domain-containing protein [Chloroflexota bacterium]